jgi:hypothetical protein
VSRRGAPRALKAISLWQPWATLIALGHKRFETRSWGTSYRGPIAIHAAKRQLAGDDCYILDELSTAHGLKLPFNEDLPFGAVVATATLADVLLMTPDLIQEQTALELDLGNWQPGRYAWRLEDVRRLGHPQPARGSQGLWNWWWPS